jgi:hypothetical protein
MAKPISKRKKQKNPQTAVVAFLELLHEISTSSRVLEFCTPGHKAGRGFLLAEMMPVRAALGQEEGQDA